MEYPEQLAPAARLCVDDGLLLACLNRPRPQGANLGNGIGGRMPLVYQVAGHDRSSATEAGGTVNCDPVAGGQLALDERYCLFDLL